MPPRVTEDLWLSKSSPHNIRAIQGCFARPPVTGCVWWVLRRVRRDPQRESLHQTTEGIRDWRSRNGSKSAPFVQPSVRSPSLTTFQMFCKEAVVWKRLNHPNVVPFRGVTFEPLQLISEWMPGGELREYVKNNRGTSLVSLVRPSPSTPTQYLIPLPSRLVSPKVLVISTRARLSTEI